MELPRDILHDSIGELIHSVFVDFVVNTETAPP